MCSIRRWGAWRTRAADFGGDGDLDVLVAEFGWRLTGRVLLLEQQSFQAGRFQFKTHVVDERHGASHVPIVDLDGDGRLDFVALISQEHETVVTFTNSGRNSFRADAIYSAPDPSYGSTAIQLADLDADGDVDVLLTNGDSFDSHILKPEHSLQWLEQRWFQLPKPQGTYRIVVVGASTVEGFPWASELSFPRHLEMILRQQYPDVEFEVLNAGITAISSFCVVDVVKQVVDVQPDLIVVHSGHNEFYGAGGFASTTLRGSQQAYPLSLAVRRLRVSQLVARMVSGEVEGNAMDVLPARLEISLQSETVAQVETAYRANLEQIVSLASAQDIPLLLTNVACNLRDQSPLRSCAEELVPEKTAGRWQQLFHDSERAAVAGDYQASLRHLDQAASLFDDYAILTYRRAQALEHLGRLNEARDAYALARDQDCCRFRTPSSFQAIVRDVAKQNADSQVVFLDVVAELQALSAPHAPGRDFFLEHVHYNLEGHWQVALVMGRRIAERILNRPWDDSRVPTIALRDELLGLIPEDRLAAYSAATQVLEAGPLRGSFDHALDRKQLADEIRAMFAALPADDREIFADLSLAQMASELLPALADSHLKQGRVDQAIALLRKHVQRRPWSSKARRKLADAVRQVGQTR